MTADSPVPAADMRPRKRQPGIARARRVYELQRGNTRAFKHGVFASVANAADVATEVALQYAARPALDPIADRRLVEELAINLVSRRRAQLAMQSDGMTAQLTSYDRSLAALVERLERAVHQREQERIAHVRRPLVDLRAYLPGGDGDE